MRTILVTIKTKLVNGGTPPAGRRNTLGRGLTSRFALSATRNMSRASFTERSPSIAVAFAGSELGRGIIPVTFEAPTADAGQAGGSSAAVTSGSGTQRRPRGYVPVRRNRTFSSTASSWSRSSGAPYSPARMFTTETASETTTAPRTSSSGRSTSRQGNDRSSSVIARPALVGKLA